MLCVQGNYRFVYFMLKRKRIPLMGRGNINFYSFYGNVLRKENLSRLMLFHLSHKEISAFLSKNRI